MSSLIAIEAPAFFLVVVFVVFCVGTSDSTEYWWIHIHWSWNVIRMASILTFTGVSRCGPLVFHVVLSFKGLSSCELMHFVLGCGNPFVEHGRLVISMEDCISQFCLETHCEQVYRSKVGQVISCNFSQVFERSGIGVKIVASHVKLLESYVSLLSLGTVQECSIESGYKLVPMFVLIFSNRVYCPVMSVS